MARKVNAFKDEVAFYDRLYDRLYTVVERYALISSGVKFTLIINAIPRYMEQFDINRENHPIQFQGLNMQQKLLGKMMMQNLQGTISEREKKVEKTNADLLRNWDFLDNYEMAIGSTSVSNKLYSEIFEHENKGEFTLQNYTQQGTLGMYFKGLEDDMKNPEGSTRPYREHEFAILSKYFESWNECRYLSVPLVQFGELDGVVHIIYEKEGFEIFNHDNGKVADDNIRDLLVGFCIEYEGVVLAWHLSYDDPDYDKDLRIAIEGTQKEEFWDERPYMFRALEFPEYYRTHYDYFITRLNQHDNVRKAFYIPVLNQAVITVLLDSYAHNIGAHTLSTLSGIFGKRADIRLKEWQYEEQLNRGYENAMLPSEYKDSYATIVNTKGPEALAAEIFPFFRFLQEKSGFWSGLTRDLNPGGLVSDLYEALMEDFASNALYLGTIAESEEINEVHLRISFLAPENLTSPVFGLVEQQVVSQGCLAYINLNERYAKHHWDANEEKFYLKRPGSDTPLWYVEHPELEQLSRFVCPGDDFEELKKRLRNVKIFWPGGIVGKHAFFNILENELRNIKHTHPDMIEKARKNGLELNISIQESRAGGQDLFRIGVWLGVETMLTQEESTLESKHLVKRRFDTLWEDIIDRDSNQPKLSGNTQDKVCAAMLFNNRFSSVQNVTWILSSMQFLAEETELRDIQFYPWVTPAVSFVDSKQEFQMRAPGSQNGLLDQKKFYGDQKKELDDAFAKEYAVLGTPRKKGFLKKYFYLWKGQNIREAGNPVSELDNIGRFKVVFVDDNKSLTKARRFGVVRALMARPGITFKDGLDDENQLMKAYRAWLYAWIGEDQLGYFWKDDNSNDFGFMSFDKSIPELLRFFTLFRPDPQKETAAQFIGSNSELEGIAKTFPDKLDVQFAHSDEKANPEALRYRRHGIMNRYFLSTGSAKKLRLEDLPKVLLPEFFEMMATRICIVDTRVQHRMQLSDRYQNFYTKQMNLLFCAEKKSEEKASVEWSLVWDDPDTKSFISNCHFLVLHLSFIENLMQGRHSDRKDDIDIFVEKELLQLVSKDGISLRQNFILVVTTGRGRSDWWKNLEKSRFTAQVIFRPIESILAAVEGHNTQKDDFELKYRLTKVLFGS